MELGKVHPDCIAFVALVEELLQRRRQELANDGDIYVGDWGPRLWIRTELEDMVYSSYKQMRRGRITRPPKRDKVMEIADYLNCSLQERNQLLVAAQSSPIDVYLTGERLQSFLEPTIEIAKMLELPAMIVNRDLRIYYLNERMLALYQLTMSQIAHIPPESLNLVRLFFDPALPLYDKVTPFTTSWLRMVRQTLYSFKIANRLCYFEDWYQALIEEWMELPHFAEHWSSVRTDIPFEEDSSALSSDSLVLESIIPRSQAHVVLRPLIISVGYFQFDFPQIMALLPADDIARLRLIEVGALA